ncbi:MAG: alpha/beta hydrolase family protein [Actinomycetota bacterium]
MRVSLKFVGLAGLLAVSALFATAAASASTEIPCSAHTYPQGYPAMTDTGIGLTSSLGLASGRYALPESSTPTQLVVMFHGHGNDSCDWRRHLQQAAAHGAIAVAMDYTGQRQYPVENYGWFVKEGAADSIAAAKYFMAAYPSIKQVFAFGISMGGNSSGLAVASVDAQRPDGTPLFDYWIDVEGVNNLAEEYLVARGVAPVNSGGALAQKEIEEENGGRLETMPLNYLETTNVYRAPDMAGLKGAIIVNGLDDGLVPTDESPQMAAALTAQGVPAHLFTVVGRGSGESGTTATAIAAGPLFAALNQPTYESPFAGHGWEGSDTQLVIKTGFDQLWSLMAGGSVTAGETIVPGV